MTGQILSGVDPHEAIKYQLLITIQIGGTTGLGVLAATFASIWRVAGGRDRLRLDRLGASATLVVRPGRYRFVDLTRVDVPMEILIVRTAVPMIMFV